MGHDAFPTKLERHFYFEAVTPCFHKRRNKNDGKRRRRFKGIGYLRVQYVRQGGNAVVSTDIDSMKSALEALIC